MVSVVSDEDHRRMRRLLSHAFSDKALTAQFPLINSYADKLVNNLRHKAKGDGGCTTVDIVKWYNYTTFDVLGELAFGEPFRCLDDDSLHPWIKTLFASLKDGSFVRIANSFPQPIKTLIKKLAPKGENDAPMEEFTFAAKKVKARMQAGEAKKVDFMSYILKHNDERGMTIPEIESNAVLLIVAGSETTATFLSGITYCLLMNPTYYTKLRDIIRTTFSDEASITPQALNQIEFLTVCLEETFRIHPPVPQTGIPRITAPEGSFVDGHFVPGNTIVMVPQLPTYMSDANFADPRKFVPERWLKGDECPERYRGDNRKAMQPFSVGPRNCIGMNLAYFEIRLIVARMLWNFDFELMDDSRDWTDQKIYTMWEKKNLNVRLTPRQV
ncbi:hypothetical protein ONS95_004403 [Cadophora gregata]|uniref:uncharacterized protein n=1 Tax=Cadophora gregata TaxID=51156 RepID=UPI0026DC6D27|nr:uncharacterized protein ONS95_004403 [Cadophora gregata]KAK0105890.1 hypothetical protein ONS95_004403 [Cadophora gregata]